MKKYQVRIGSFAFLLLAVVGVIHIACVCIGLAGGDNVTMKTLLHLVVDAALINIGLAMANILKD